MKGAINYIFHKYVSGCRNMKVQNAFLTKFMVIKLKIDAVSIFVIVFKKCPTKYLMNRFFS